MMPERESFNEVEAREWLGVTADRWRALKAAGAIKSHPITRTYLVEDLRALLKKPFVAEVIELNTDGDVPKKAATMASKTPNKWEAKTVLRQDG